MVKAHERGAVRVLAYTKITGIYAVRCRDKTYFGSSVCIKSRLNTHKRELRQGKHSNSYLQRVYDKYSEEFKFEVVEECSREVLRHREQHYIDTFKGELLNLAKTVCELAPPEEHAERMKGAWAKRTAAEKAAIGAKVSATLKDRYKHDPEMLEKAQQNLAKGRSSEALKTRKNSPEANEKRRVAAKKQWAARSAEQRKAVSAKVSKGMMEKQTAEQRSNNAKNAANARSY